MSMGAIALVGTGAAINFVAAVADDRDPFPMLIATVILLWILIGIDAIAEELGTAFGAAFLLVAFLTHGDAVADFINSATSQKPATPPRR